MVNGLSLTSFRNVSLKLFEDNVVLRVGSSNIKSTGFGGIPSKVTVWFVIKFSSKKGCHRTCSPFQCWRRLNNPREGLKKIIMAITLVVIEKKE